MISNVTDFVTQYKPSSKVQIGIGGYLLDVRLKEEVLQEAVIPEFPVEDGSILQDHIIIKPVTITISGDISDIHIRPTVSPLSGTLSRLNDLTDTATLYFPGKTTSQLRKIRNTANKLNAAGRGLQNLLTSGANLFDLVDDNPNSNTQDFFDKMSTAHKTKQAIAVTTPFKTYDNMVIMTLLTSADNEATSLGYEVTFKEIRIAVNRTEPFNNIINDKTRDKTSGKTNIGFQNDDSTPLPQPLDNTTTPLTTLEYINRASLTIE